MSDDLPARVAHLIRTRGDALYGQPHDGPIDRWASAAVRALREAVDLVRRQQEELAILGDALDSAVTGTIEATQPPRWDQDKLVLSQGWNTPERCGKCGETNAEVGRLRAALAAAQPRLEALDRHLTAAIALELEGHRHLAWYQDTHKRLVDVAYAERGRAVQDQPTTEQPTPPKRITGEPPGWEGTRAVHERAVARFGRPSTEQPCPCCVGGTLQPEFDVACPVCGGSGRVPTTPTDPLRINVKLHGDGAPHTAVCERCGAYDSGDAAEFAATHDCRRPAGPEGATP